MIGENAKCMEDAGEREGKRKQPFPVHEMRAENDSPNKKQIGNELK